MKSAKYYSYKDRLIINTVCTIIFALISAIMIVFSLSTETPFTFSYREKSSLDYKVYLIENDFFEEPFLGKDMQYVASLIDYIDVFFNYNYEMSTEVNYIYKYYVESEVLVYDRDDSEKTLFQRKNNITDEKSVELFGVSNFQLNENIKINYDDYNELVKSFTDNFNLNAESVVKLRLYVEVISNHERFSEPIETKNVMEMTIPLTKRTINVDMNYNEINDSDKFTETSSAEPINFVLILAGSLCAAVSAVFFGKLTLLLRKSQRKISSYEKLINKLKREFDRAIVNVKKVVDITDDMNVIDVLAFEELLDVSDRLELPILFMEIHKGQKAWFIVRNGNDVYRLIIKAADL